MDPAHSILVLLCPGEDFSSSSLNVSAHSMLVLAETFPVDPAHSMLVLLCPGGDFSSGSSSLNVSAALSWRRLFQWIQLTQC